MGSSERVPVGRGYVRVSGEERPPGGVAVGASERVPVRPAGASRAHPIARFKIITFLRKYEKKVAPSSGREKAPARHSAPRAPQACDAVLARVLVVQMPPP